MIDGLTIALLVEGLASGANLLYVLLLIRERIACWAFGIIGSLLSVFLFLEARLYSESLLYVFYAGMAAWGWFRWHGRQAVADNPVIRWQFAQHLRAIIMTTLLALGLGYSLHFYSDAERPLFDAFTTVFSFLGTYLQINKVLESWLYWIVINLASVWLYLDSGLAVYAVLMVFYALLSVSGYLQWRRSQIH
ncbi:MAG: nicotinamide mononucleotide transporter [Halieaceae bacterium]|nr:nicotinamide mononucleotide transporter [Halieaceae bacterium]MCP4466531.1 nicotinamide mononucleotide transporter [Halieaceae bacterium]MCP4840523.1 nicotinamide mononucleotide transporter [Halieaceae bacterium]MDG2412009.1 nicotinamide riboside transporter PnuC [Halioglobus sp.]